GHHVAKVVFEQSAADMRESVSQLAATDGDTRMEQCRALFTSLVRRWFAMPPAFESTFLESTHGYIDIQEVFRRDALLHRLSAEIYPEFPPPANAVPQETAEQQAARERAERHVIAQMFQVMENAWLSLNLDV